MARRHQRWVWTALLDFDIKLTLDGKSLSPREIEALLASTDGLVLVKGKWVEVDREKLSEVLDQWRDVQQQAREGRVSFGEAMRMLAGAQLDGGDTDSTEDVRPEWSEVIAGKWLSSRLDTLRSPELQAEINAGAGLRAELRPYQKLGVQWLWTLRGLELGGCLADDMGLGKTIQVLGLLSLSRGNREPGTDLLVVPASIVDNWRLEIERFAPQLKVLIAHPSHIPSPELKRLSRKAVDAHDAVITTYGTAMRTEWMKSHTWRNVILDEAQAIKARYARTAQPARAAALPRFVGAAECGDPLPIHRRGKRHWRKEMKNRFPGSSEEIVEAATKGVVSMIPVVGGLLAELGAVLVNPLDTRKRAWIKEVEKALTELSEKHQRLPDALVDDPAFVTAFLKATAAALATHHEIKIQALREFIVAVGAKSVPDEELQHALLRLLEDLSVGHIEVLLFLKKGSSAESVGDFWFRQVTQRVVQSAISRHR